MKGRTVTPIVMRLSMVVPLALLMLLSTLAPVAMISSEELTDMSLGAGAKDPPCPATNVSTLPSQVNLADQSCMQVSLGTLAPGSLVSIDVSVAGSSADLLIFAANSVGTYLNDQSYRSELVWESDASVEDLSGDAEWHWEVPDRSETVWYLILDNLAHAGDGGNGGQGGSQSNISISVTFPTMSYWTLIDSLQVLSPGSHAALLGPSELTLDTGTQVSITALPLSGTGDIFIMTEDQKDTYLMGGGGAFWVPGTQMLSISTATSQPWTVPSDLSNQPLYLFLDNEAGPTGGGDGSTELKITVSVTLLPVLNPVISSADNLNDIDVEEQVSFNVDSTPNLSQQVDLTQTEWDFDNDGIIDDTGSSVTTSYSSPGNRSVKATVQGPDGRSNSVSIAANVIDSTNPIANILGSNVWQRDVDADFTLTSTSTDNWQIIREEWRVDGVLVSSYTSTPSSFTHSLNTTGNHTVELTAVDGANNIDAVVVTISVRDGTKPVVGEIVAEDSVMSGVEMIFTVNASDPESTMLAYVWDFNKEVDADGDGFTSNDAQAVGPTVSWTFSTAQPTYVICTVTNDANLSKTVQHLVDVEVDPAAAANSSSPFDSATPFIVLLLLILIGGGGWFAWKKRQNQLENEAIALANAAAQEEVVPEPERDDQLSMYAPASSQSGGYGGGDSIASLAGADYNQGRASADTLSAFMDDEDTEIVQEKEAILDDLDFLKKQDKKPAKKAEPVEAAVPKKKPAAEQGRVAKKSSGIALPDSAGVTTSQPVETVKQSEPEPVPKPEPAVVPEESDVTTVKASCPACDQMFAVDMPNDVDQALVACPKCDQRIRLEK